MALKHPERANLGAVADSEFWWSMNGADAFDAPEVSSY
jgi:hypothetical protein